MTELDRHILRADRAAEAALARQLDPAAFISYAKTGTPGRRRFGAWLRDRVRPAPLAHVAADLGVTPGTFRGRAVELAELVERHDRARREGPRQPLLMLLHGMPGVGKTVLAWELARRLAPEYPDGTWYADVGSADRPRPPAEILWQFLAALGWSGTPVPGGTADRVRLFHSMTAGRQILFVLDAVHRSDQIMPVLPAEPGCAVIVTSRRNLGPDLNAPSLHLGVPPVGEALEILAAAAGTDWLTQAEQATEIVGRCGRLPLAIRAAGERIARGDDAVGRPERTRLSHDDWDGRVWERIDSAYGRLAPREQQALCLLALVPSTTFASWVLGRLLDVDRPEAEDLVASLAVAQLLDTAGPARYAFHPLVQLFARRMLAVGGAPTQAPRARLDDAYIELADGMLAERQPGYVRRYAGPRRFASGTVADEYHNLIRVVRVAAQRDDDELCWRVGALLGDCVPTGVSVPASLAAFDLAIAAGDDDPVGAVDTRLARASFLIAIERYEEGLDLLDRTVHIGQHRLDRIRRQRADAYLQMGMFGMAEGRSSPFWVELRLSDAARGRADWTVAEALLRAVDRLSAGDARRMAIVRYRLARLYLEQWRHEMPDAGVPRPDGTAVRVPARAGELAERAVMEAAEAVLAFRAMDNEIGVLRARGLEIRALVVADRLVAAEALCHSVWESTQRAELKQSPAWPALLADFARACGDLVLHIGDIDVAWPGLVEAAKLYERHGDWDAHAEIVRLLGAVRRLYPEARRRDPRRTGAARLVLRETGTPVGDAGVHDDAAHDDYVR